MPGKKRSIHCVRCGSTERYASGKCGPCSREYTKQYRQQNRDKVRESQQRYVSVNRVKRSASHARWRRENPEKVRRQKRAGCLARYNLTGDEYCGLLDEQHGTCAICKTTCETGRALAVDHCHGTGRIRGLLCFNCNHGIGKFKDDPNRLRAAANYLEQSMRGQAVARFVTGELRL